MALPPYQLIFPVGDQYSSFEIDDIATVFPPNQFIVQEISVDNFADWMCRASEIRFEEVSVYYGISSTPIITIGTLPTDDPPNLAGLTFAKPILQSNIKYSDTINHIGMKYIGEQDFSMGGNIDVGNAGVGTSFYESKFTNGISTNFNLASTSYINFRDNLHFFVSQGKFYIKIIFPQGDYTSVPTVVVGDQFIRFSYNSLPDPTVFSLTTYVTITKTFP